MTGPLRTKKAVDLVAGDVLALPFGKTALLTEVKVGTKFVSFSFVQNGVPAHSRVHKYRDDIPVEGPDDTLSTQVSESTVKARNERIGRLFGELADLLDKREALDKRISAKRDELMPLVNDR